MCQALQQPGFRDGECWVAIASYVDTSVPPPAHTPPAFPKKAKATFHQQPQLFSSLYHSFSRVFLPLSFSFSFTVDWCKSSCTFALLKLVVWYWNIFLNKCGYVIYHFNAHFSLDYFLLMVCYLLFFYIYLNYRNDVRQKANLRDFLNLSSKWVKQQRQLNSNNAFGPGTANKC